MRAEVFTAFVPLASAFVLFAAERLPVGLAALFPTSASLLTGFGEFAKAGWAGHSWKMCTDSGDYSGHANIVSRRAIISMSMARGGAMTKLAAARLLIILCALVSLCVSDTVGPRLLPLPAPASGSTAATRQAFEGADVTPAPSRGETAVVRVAMAAPARKQAGVEQHQLFLTAAVKGLLKPPAEAPPSVQSARAPAPQSSAAVTRPPGRGPPPSV